MNNLPLPNRTLLLCVLVTPGSLTGPGAAFTLRGDCKGSTNSVGEAGQRSAEGIPAGPCGAVNFMKEKKDKDVAVKAAKKLFLSLEIPEALAAHLAFEFVSYSLDVDRIAQRDKMNSIKRTAFAYSAGFIKGLKYSQNHANN